MSDLRMYLEVFGICAVTALAVVVLAAAMVPVLAVAIALSVAASPVLVIAAVCDRIRGRSSEP